MFQSPKTGLFFSHRINRSRIVDSGKLFQSPKTGLFFSHGFIAPALAEENIAMFQSPKTGLFFSHDEINRDVEDEITVSIP